MNYCVYIGYSSNFNARSLFHENQEKRKYTYNADDWIVYYKIDCKSKSQGLAIEAHIKRMKSKIYIQNLLKYPEITLKLLLKFKDCQSESIKLSGKLESLKRSVQSSTEMLDFFVLFFLRKY